MTKRLQLTIHYKTGAVIRQLVHYVEYIDGCIVYAVDHQASSAVQLQCKTSLNNVETFDVTQVSCEGWKIKKATLSSIYGHQMNNEFAEDGSDLILESDEEV